MNHEQRVEVVAEVIRDAYEHHAKAKYGEQAHLTPWTEMPDHRRDKWRDMARAAIEVMRS